MRGTGGDVDTARLMLVLLSANGLVIHALVVGGGGLGGLASRPPGCSPGQADRSPGQHTG